MEPENFTKRPRLLHPLQARSLFQSFRRRSRLTPRRNERHVTSSAFSFFLLSLFEPRR
jgi:hypothetical protein